MAQTRIPMTPNGKLRLEKRLRELKQKERPENIDALEKARAHGDISENADYDAAKERQAFIEGSIRSIEDKLARAQVIDPKKIKSDQVIFGAKVILENQDTGKKVTYQIVGEDEANIKQGKLAIHAPLARALIGKTKGSEVTVHAPKGAIDYEILDISYQ